LKRLLLERVLRLSGASVKIAGGRRDLVLRMGDILYPKLRTSGRRELPFGDGRLDVDPARPSERLLCYAAGSLVRYYEHSPLFSVMRRYLRGGETFVDVGANLGVYSILAKTRLGARTVCFEPEPAHLEFLRRNEWFFDEIHADALGDAAGEAVFHVSGGNNPAGSSLVDAERANGESIYTHSIRVNVRTFSEALAGRDVRFVKIDVEGAEAAAVRGMTAFLESGARPHIWCEVRGAASDRNADSFREVIDALRPFGYHAFFDDAETPFDDTDAPARTFDLFFETA
jgi:FkbM family methyltransferase